MRPAWPVSRLPSAQRCRACVCSRSPRRRARRRARARRAHRAAPVGRNAPRHMRRAGSFALRTAATPPTRIASAAAALAPPRARPSRHSSHERARAPRPPARARRRRCARAAQPRSASARRRSAWSTANAPATARARCSRNAPARSRPRRATPKSMAFGDYFEHVGPSGDTPLDAHARGRLHLQLAHRLRSRREHRLGHALAGHAAGDRRGLDGLAGAPREHPRRDASATPASASRRTRSPRSRTARPAGSTRRTSAHHQALSARALAVLIPPRAPCQALG